MNESLHTEGIFPGECPGKITLKGRSFVAVSVISFSKEMIIPV